MSEAKAVQWNPDAQIVRSSCVGNAADVSVEVSFDATGDHAAVHLTGAGFSLKLFGPRAHLLARLIERAARAAMGREDDGA